MSAHAPSGGFIAVFPLETARAPDDSALDKVEDVKYPINEIVYRTVQIILVSPNARGKYFTISEIRMTVTDDRQTDNRPTSASSYDFKTFPKRRSFITYVSFKGTTSLY
jgi:hypothetical protein